MRALAESWPASGRLGRPVTNKLAAGTLITGLLSGAYAQPIKLLKNNRDPYGYPRPANGETNVPTGTSIFFELNIQDGTKAKPVEPSLEAQVGGFDLAGQSKDVIDLDSITVQLRREDQPPFKVLGQGQHFTEGYSGTVKQHGTQKSTVIVYIDSNKELNPLTTYYITVNARSRNGAVLGKDGQWRFITEEKAAVHPVSFQLDLSRPPVRWHGGFFTGFCKTTFCTSSVNRMQSYELMDQVRKQCPKAWSVVRDIHLGSEYQPKDNSIITWALPNIVRERETRCIAAIEDHPGDGKLLRVEDFFGHEQYGIESNRPLAGDYHAGDEILVADGISDARAKVIRIVDDSGPLKSLLVTAFTNPAVGWKTEYTKPLPTKEDLNWPGLFPAGGCYLRKFDPAGTPHYYWGRLDKEWDIHQRQFGRRLEVNICAALGDVSIDGRDWNRPKDYVEHHQVVYDLAAHVIDRYGKASLSFYWSVFNEVDLAANFWRCKDWNEMQRFYDYTVDAVCRAFEDRGYDSSKVIVGGLELGAIFGAKVDMPALRYFLVHCSPTATGSGALPQNAAFIDRSLDGKRSNRVENLCGKTGGKGSPCDFISVHTYNASPVAAAKLTNAKKIALEVDSNYYADLWINSGESCPGWSPPPDTAAAESYMANGFWPTWSADFARRLLAQAAEDKRHAFGESLISVWPWPNRNFERNLDSETRLIAVDDDGDGRKDRDQIIAEPTPYFVGLMAGMGDDYLVLPEQKIGGFAVSGFASKKPDAINAILYSHDPLDIQSRSKNLFEITLDLSDIPWSKVRVTEYRYDKDNNSYYRLALELRDRPASKVALAGQEVCYSAEEAARLKELSMLHVTKDSRHSVGAGGTLRLPITVAANGANFVVIEPAANP